MNASKFMDKQIMEFSAMQTADPSDQPKPNDDQNHESQGGASSSSPPADEDKHQEQPQMQQQQQVKEEQILPGSDFTPFEGLSPSGASAERVGAWTPPPTESKPKQTPAFGFTYSSELPPSKLKSSCDPDTVASIVKEHADILLKALEGVSSRLSQLESRTQHLESSVDELKMSVGDNVGNAGKLKQLENILREVQTGMQILCDKQENALAQLQLSKLQSSKDDRQYLNTTPAVLLQQPAQQQQPLQPPPQPPVVIQQPSHPAFPTPVPDVPAPPPQQYPPPVQYPPQVPHTHIPSVPALPQELSFPPPGQTQETTHQYQPPVQQSQPSTQQHYQLPQRQSQYSQPPQPAKLQPSFPHHSEETSHYMPPHQAYPSSIHQPAPPSQPLAGSPPQQFYGPSSDMYESPTNRPSVGKASYGAGYGTPPGPAFSEPYPYSGSPSHHSSSSMRPPPFASSAPSSSGSNYPRLPTAKILPQAVPTGSGSDGSSGNRVPIDDVVDKVATMGFSRDQVRATVRKLTENGQSVDLNVVLDKLMNGGDVQPHRSW